MTSTSSEIRLQNVNHVVYLVRDLERSLTFYRDFLGIKQIPKMVDSDDLEWLQLPSGVMVHLLQSDELAPQRQHVAFEVEDLDTARRAVEQQGIEIMNSGTRNDGQRYIFFPDPDGNRVELCTPSGF